MAKTEVQEGIEAAMAGLADSFNHLADATDRLATVYEDMIERGGVAAEVSLPLEEEQEPKPAAKPKPKAKPKAKDPEPESEEETEEETEEDSDETPDIEAVRDAVRSVMQALGKEDAFKILGDHGADGVSELKEKHYADVISACGEAIASDPSA